MGNASMGITAELLITALRCARSSKRGTHVAVTLREWVWPQAQRRLPWLGAMAQRPATCIVCGIEVWPQAQRRLPWLGAMAQRPATCIVCIVSMAGCTRGPARRPHVGMLGLRFGPVPLSNNQPRELSTRTVTANAVDRPERGRTRRCRRVPDGVCAVRIRSADPFLGCELVRLKRY